jgi:DNA replication protein DnaC
VNAPTVSPELKALLRRVKLGRCLDTLPERLALAHTGGMGHAEFLELVLADEVTRRETTSADRRARAAGLDPAMTLDRWDDTANVTYDRAVWNELCSLRFVDAGHNAVIMGPVGVGKTFLATALGHAAVRRRVSVHFERCDRLLKRLRSSRLDDSHDVEMRKLLRVDLLIIDDFALQALDALDTSDIYELVVERHRAAATVVTSNREPIEWLGLMADPLLAQSAIDRLQSAAHELVLDGESYRQRQSRPSPRPTTTPLTTRRPPGDHPVADADTPRNPVPCHWRTGGPIELAHDMGAHRRLRSAAHDAPIYPGSSSATGDRSACP